MPERSIAEKERLRKRRLEFVAPVEGVKPRGFDFLGYFAMVRIPDEIEIDGTGTKQLKTSIGLEIPFGECRRCGAIIKLVQANRRKHLDNCGGK